MSFVEHEQFFRVAILANGVLSAETEGSASALYEIDLMVTAAVYREGGRHSFIPIA